MTRLLFLAALNCIVTVAIAKALIRKYAVCRDQGLVWLGAALVVWPIISGIMRYVENVIIMERFVLMRAGVFYPFSLVEQGKVTFGVFTVMLSQFHHLVCAVLAFVGILMLNKNRAPAPGNSSRVQSRKNDTPENMGLE